MARRTAWLGAAGVAGGLIALGVVVFVPLMVYPLAPGIDLGHVTEPQSRVVVQQGQLQSNLRSSLLQFFGGLLVVAGAAATWRQVQVNRDGQITDRFSRAVEHLANKNRDVRIGGLYVLERIAKDSPQDRRFVQVTMGNFLRNKSPWAVGSPKGPEHPTPTVDGNLQWLRLRAPDVQAAVTILSRLPMARDAPPLLLSYADLRSVQLEDARLTGAVIRRSNLARARLRGTRMDGCDLEATDLRKASLRNASLRNSSLRNVYLEGADLRGADLQGADLRGAHADAETIWPPELTPEALRQRGVIVQ
ncbi:pentapeptide repeat-containing protein [Lentzea alba]|uniref:pentapeptide repeat-containing protein n=1 Tax=Lentzea alba TaxID=2714351 RepID=UPI0039BF70AE